MDITLFQKVLVLSPHTDDGELGAGGTIAKLVDNDCKITYFVFSSPRQIVKKECKESLEILGVEEFQIFDFKIRHFPKQRQEILQVLYDYNQEYEPDLVFTPSTHDTHQDHQVVANETLRAFKRSTILGYELPWNNIFFHENCFVALNQSNVECKINALNKYETQKERHYFDSTYIKSILMSRGGQIRELYAEAFEVIKLVLKTGEGL
jgi:LmbE family N-acetylglucosaminyl deacetylase